MSSSTEWGWYASEDEENYTVGPEASRDAVIAAGRVDFDGQPFFILEAIKPAAASLIPNARSFIESALEAAADDEQFGEDGDFDLSGSQEEAAAAYAELDAALSAWVEKWARILPTPRTFHATRNAEVIQAGDPQ